MRIFKSTVVCIASILVAACSSSDDIQVVNSDQFLISIDDALSNLDFFNQNLENHQPDFVRSSGSDSKQIGDIIPVFPQNVLNGTRSVDSPILDAQPLLYIVNYRDDNGFALLAADSRISGTVIAVTEKGNMNGNLIVESADSPKYQYSDFPIFLKEFITHYIETSIMEYDKSRSTSEMRSDTRSHDPLVCVAPMFTNWWGQWYPFNMYSPTENGKTCPTGCVALATAMAITYLNRNTTSYSYMNGNYIDFPSIQNAYRVMPGSAQPDFVDFDIDDQIACVIRHMGYLTHTTYHSNESSANLLDAVHALDSLGYNATRKLNFKVSYATSMLPAGKPIIMSGYSNSFFANGHAWLVDGIEQYYLLGPDEVYTMLHCNWGFDGIGNGYYYDDAFCPLDGTVNHYYYDGRTVQPSDSLHNFNHLHRTVVY